MGLLISVGLLVAGFVVFFTRGYDIDVAQGLALLRARTVEERAALARWGRAAIAGCERAIGRLAKNLLFAGSMIVVGLWHYDLLATWNTLICAFVAVGGIVWIQRQMPLATPLVAPAANANLMSRFMYRVRQALRFGLEHRTPFTTSVVAVFGFSATLLLISASAKKQELAIIAMLYLVYVMPGLVLAIAWPPLKALESGIRLTEFTSDAFFRVAGSLGDALKGLRAERRPGEKVEIFDEKMILKIFFVAIFTFISAVAVASIANVYFPGLVTIKYVSGLASMPLLVCWIVLFGAGVDITRRRVCATLFLELAVLAAATVTIAHAIFPSLWSSTVTWIKDLWRNGLLAMNPWSAGVGLGVFSTAVILLLWLWKAMPNPVLMRDGTYQFGIPFARYTRNALACVCLAAALICASSLAFAGHYRGRADMVGADGVRLSEMQAMTAYAETGGVRLTWDKAEGAIGYRLEWRKSSEGEFHGVVGAENLRKGVLQFLDTDVERGEEYLYRVMALYPKGKSEPCAEVRVSIPAEREKAAMPDPDPPSHPAKDDEPPKPAPKPKPAMAKAVDPCAGDSCPVSSDLAALCTRWGCK